jgi:hypothetical protein
LLEKSDKLEKQTSTNFFDQCDVVTIFIIGMKLRLSFKFETDTVREGENRGAPIWHLAMLIGGNKQRRPKL